MSDITEHDVSYFRKSKCEKCGGYWPGDATGAADICACDPPPWNAKPSLSDQVKALEIRADKAKTLAGEILNCIKINRMRGTIKCVRDGSAEDWPKGEKSFSQLMDGFYESLKAL